MVKTFSCWFLSVFVGFCHVFSRTRRVSCDLSRIKILCRVVGNFRRVCSKTLDKVKLCADCQFFMKQFFFGESKNFLSRRNRHINQSLTSIIDHPKMPLFSNLLKELEAVVKSHSQKPYNKKNLS